MTPEDLEQMKNTPGLYVVTIDEAPLAGELLVASIDGKLYGMVATNELRDDGWHQKARQKKIMDGHFSRVQA